MIGLLTGCRARASLCSVTLRTGAPKTSHSDSSTCSQCLAIQPVIDVHSESVKSNNLLPAPYTLQVCRVREYVV